MGFIVKTNGFLTTVQDRGRYGYQKSGISVSGAMDIYSMELANILVGNDKGEAVLEMLMMGSTLEFTDSGFIAVTGGDFQPKINGKDAEMYCALFVKTGDVLSFGAAKEGNYCYVAFAGGMDAEKVLGSCSTYIKAAIGPMGGRALKTGDEIRLKKHVGHLINMSMRQIERPEIKKSPVLRVVLGPQDDFFDEENKEKFFRNSYTVTQEFDRMGCRLKGEPIVSQKGHDIISDGIARGAVQIPKHGQPIIMMADRQTAGGYTKIATVVSADTDVLAQTAVGDKVSFEKVTVEQAAEIYAERKKMLDSLEEKLNKTPQKRVFIVEVNDKKYQLTLEE